VECVREGARTVRQPRLQFGGRQRSTTPVVTYALIALNVLAFILQMVSVGVERQPTLWSPAVADGEVYRLVTSAFLHYGVTHLLFNMWALYVVGPRSRAGWAGCGSARCTHSPRSFISVANDRGSVRAVARR
jgi:membrane associated rhomboid family serine protease